MYEDLKLGDMGNDVFILQEKLKTLGFYNAVITGNFGRATEEGVKSFQRISGLDETGVVDQETWYMLIRDTEQAVSMNRALPTLSLGSTGSYVRDLQTKLTALLFYTGEINGNFDSETEISVKRFQLNNELTANGVVNDQTWTLINTLYGNLNSCVLGEDNDNNDYFEYTVVEGDSLSLIAQSYGTTVSAIKSLNGLTSDLIQIGQVLKIPSAGSSSGTTDSYFEYTVVRGDSLSLIAGRYGTTVSAIKSLNGLTSDLIQIGQILKIPGSNPDTGTDSGSNNYFDYTVVRGDSLYSIASRYNTTVSAIKSLNGLTSDLLQIGQVLRIPGSSSGTGSNSGTTSNYFDYTVVRGDSLSLIAQRYNTTVAAIKSLNGLTSDLIVIGQVLKIPSSSTTNNYFNYVVVKGDNLSTIASRYGTTVATIKSLNGLTSDLLQIGQVLRIPF